MTTREELRDKMEKVKISAIIITKDEEKVIKDCLKSVSWTDEAVVVDSGSSDKTLSIAKKLGAKIYLHRFKDFADQRNFVLTKVTGDWIFYLDADERVSQELAEEIVDKIKNAGDFVAFKIPRLNIFFGKQMRYGGWYPDYQTRLFKKENFEGWHGAVHESAQVKGKTGKLKNPLIHLTHRSLGACFEKSITWTKMEADLLYKAGHPKVTVLHLIKVAVWEFFWRVFLKQGFRDGVVGWLEGLIQAFNRFLVYAQLWEKQQKFGH